MPLHSTTPVLLCGVTHHLGLPLHTQGWQNTRLTTHKVDNTHGLTTHKVDSTQGWQNTRSTTHTHMVQASWACICLKHNHPTWISDLCGCLSFLRATPAPALPLWSPTWWEPTHAGPTSTPSEMLPMQPIWRLSCAHSTLGCWCDGRRYVGETIRGQVEVWMAGLTSTAQDVSVTWCDSLT